MMILQTQSERKVEGSPPPPPPLPSDFKNENNLKGVSGKINLGYGITSIELDAH